MDDRVRLIIAEFVRAAEETDVDPQDVINGVREWITWLREQRRDRAMANFHERLDRGVV